MHSGHGSSNNAYCAYSAYAIMPAHAKNPATFKVRLEGIFICNLGPSKLEIDVELNAIVIVFNTLETIYLIDEQRATQ